MSSWFYNLRRKRSATSCQATGFVSKPATQNQKPPPPSPKTPPPPCSPNRASYYFPTRDRALSPRPANDNPKLRDTRFPQPSDIVFDVVSRRDDMFGAVDDAMHELKLRPILTRPVPSADASDSSGTASPTARVRRPLLARAPSGRRNAVAGLPAETCRRRRRAGKLRWLYESVVLVKESAEPEEDFVASMAEMISANDVRSPGSLQELLACYLALNAAEHHRAIVAAFRRAWLELDFVPPPPPLRERCRYHPRCV